MTTWKQWSHGLVAALIGGLSPFGTIGIAGYAENYSLDWDFWRPVLWGAAFNAWLIFEAYRKQFPPPGLPRPQDPPAH